MSSFKFFEENLKFTFFLNFSSATADKSSKNQGNDETDSSYILIDSSSQQKNYNGVGFKHFRAVFYKKSIYIKRKMTYFFIMVRESAPFG